MTRIFGQSFEDVVKQGSCHIAWLFACGTSNYLWSSHQAQATHKKPGFDWWRSKHDEYEEIRATLDVLMWMPTKGSVINPELSSLVIRSHLRQRRSVAKKITSNLTCNDSDSAKINHVSVLFWETLFMFMTVLYKFLSQQKNNMSFLNLHHQSIVSLWTCDSLQFSFAFNLVLQKYLQPAWHNLHHLRTQSHLLRKKDK